MYQLAYLSFASSLFNTDTDAGVDQILMESHKYNADRDISGMLLFKGGVFLQLLEGEKTEVHNLFGRIASDLRHEGIKVLVKQEVSERLYAKWSMGYAKVSQIDLEAINNIIPWNDIIDKTRNRQTIPNDKIFEIFKKFRFKV